MTNITPINPITDDPDEHCGFAGGLMKAIQELLQKDEGVVKMRIMDNFGCFDCADMRFLLDDGDVYNIRIHVVGHALDMTPPSDD